MGTKLIKITQVRSSIGCPKNCRLSLRALGLRRIGSIVYRFDTESIRGIINVVKYLIKLEYI